MTTPGPFVAVLITLLVVGAIVQLLVLTYRYVSGDFRSREEADGGEFEYVDDRIPELGKAGRSQDDRDDPDLDSTETETVPCPRCDTLNEAGYTFCRHCTATISVN